MAQLCDNDPAKADSIIGDAIDERTKQNFRLYASERKVPLLRWAEPMDAVLSPRLLVYLISISIHLLMIF